MSCASLQHRHRISDNSVMRVSLQHFRTSTRMPSSPGDLPGTRKSRALFSFFLVLDCCQALPVQAGYQWDLGRRPKPHFLWREAQSNALAGVPSAAMILDDFREAVFFCVGPSAILIPSYISLIVPVSSAICIWEQSLSLHGFCCWRPRSSGSLHSS